MLSYFCSKCGGKNLYQFQKPKFCSHCGASFASAAISNNNVKLNQFEVNINNNKSINQNNYNSQVQDIDQDLEYDYGSMHGLDVNIEKYNKNDGIKLGDLVSDEPIAKNNTNKKITKQRRGRKKVVKSLPESFISEAKMSGRNYQDGPQINDIEE